MSAASAGYLSVLFDVGGIIGGILAGFISDHLNARATTAAVFMYLAIPSLFLFHGYGSISKATNIGLMMISGLFVNGPYALITTAVSADLGTHKSLKGDSRALTTVTAIIDGTGSLGAALGPFLTGFISRRGWDSVFVMLALCAFVAAVLLSSHVKIEIPQIIEKWRNRSTNMRIENEGKCTSVAISPILRLQILSFLIYLHDLSLSRRSWCSATFRGGKLMARQLSLLHYVRQFCSVVVSEESDG